MFIGLFSPRLVPRQTPSKTPEIRSFFRRELFSSAFHELEVVFTGSPQQSHSGIFQSEALWLTIPKEHVSLLTHHSIHAQH